MSHGYHDNGLRDSIGLAASASESWTQSCARDLANCLTNIISGAGAFTYRYPASGIQRRVSRLSLTSVARALGFALFLWMESPSTIEAAGDTPICPSSSFGLSDDQLRSFAEKAAKGDGEAAFRIALHYEYVQFDDAARLKWFKRAEELGHSEAAWILAYHYRYNARPPDHKAAFALSRKWAERGSVRAMIELGDMLERGLGVSKDRVEAMKWYEKAARIGKVFTMEELSRMLLEDGKVSEAYVWAEVVSLRKKRVGPDKIKQSNPVDLAKRLSAEELKQAKKRAVKLDKEIPYIEPWTNW